MNEREFDRTARAWLHDGPTRMSDRAVLSALAEIHKTRQRRAWLPARRATPMSIYLRAAIAAVLVVGIGLVAINVLPRGSDGSGVGSEPTATPSASPPPSAAPPAAVPELTETFISESNGFSVRYPEDATINQATELWVPDGNVPDNATYDFVHSDTFGSFGGSSTAMPDAVSIDEWVDQELDHDTPGGCAVPRSDMPQMTIDGQPGRVWEGCPGEVAATVVVDGRLYFFILFGDTASRAVFDAYAATIDLRPEEAAVPSASP